MLLLWALGLLHLLAGFVFAAVHLRPENRTEHCLLACLTAWVTFYIVPIAAGWLTGYMNWYTLLAGAAAALALAATATARRPWGSFTRWLPAGIIHRPVAEWFIWLVMATLLLMLLMAGSVLPARTSDAPAYHMSNPMRWHLSGRFILDSFGGLELGPQLLSAECAPNVKAVWPWAVLLFTSDTPATCLAQFPYLVILLFAVRALALRLGASGWLASLAALGCAVVPEILLQSLDAYADLVFAAGQVVLVWALVYFWQSKLTGRSIAFPAIGFGIMAGAKAAVLASGGLMGLLYGILLLWRLAPQQRGRASLWVAAALAMVAFGMLVSGGPWFIHSWKEYGSPVFPYQVQVGERVLFKGPMSSDLNSGMIQTYTGATGAAAYWNTLKEIWRPPSLSSWAGGLGAGMFIIGIPALVIFLLSSLAPGSSAGARRIVCLSFLLYAAATPTLAVARFSLYQPILGLVAFACIGTIIPFLVRMVAVVMVIGVMSYDLYMTVPSLLYRQQSPWSVTFSLLSGWPRASQMLTSPDQDTALNYWCNEVSRPGRRLAIHSSNTPLWYCYAPWSPADILRFRDPAGSEDLENWHSEMLEAGVTHLYLQKIDPGYSIALSRPDLFPVLQHRLDSHSVDNTAGFPVYVWPEDVLFSVAGGTAL